MATPYRAYSDRDDNNEKTRKKFQAACNCDTTFKVAVLTLLIVTLLVAAFGSLPGWMANHKLSRHTGQGGCAANNLANSADLVSQQPTVGACARSILNVQRWQQAMDSQDLNTAISLMDANAILVDHSFSGVPYGGVWQGFDTNNTRNLFAALATQQSVTVSSATLGAGTLQWNCAARTTTQAYMLEVVLRCPAAPSVMSGRIRTPCATRIEWSADGSRIVRIESFKDSTGPAIFFVNHCGLASTRQPGAVPLIGSTLQESALKVVPSNNNVCARKIQNSVKLRSAQLVLDFGTLLALTESDFTLIEHAKYLPWGGTYAGLIQIQGFIEKFTQAVQSFAPVSGIVDSWNCDASAVTLRYTIDAVLRCPNNHSITLTERCACVDKFVWNADGTKAKLLETHIDASAAALFYANACGIPVTLPAPGEEPCGSNSGVIPFYSVAPTAPNPACPLLFGKTALVTGASSGIGRATALRLVQLGMNVYGTSRNPAGVLNPPAGVTMLQLEYADDASIDALVQYFTGNAITVDLLYGNGATGSVGFTRFFSEEDIDYVQRATYTGHTKLQRKLLSRMPTTGYARVIETASTAAYLPGAISAFYDASKASMLNYMAVQDMHARLIGSNLRYLTINPGQVNTSLFYNAKFGSPMTPLDPEFKAAIAINVTLETLLKNAGASPDWIAQAVIEVACAANPMTETFALYPPGYTTPVPGFEDPNAVFLTFFNVRLRQGLAGFASVVLSIFHQTIQQLFP